MPEIRFLDRLNVRDAWPHEAAHFTPWLARGEPLALAALFATCGIDLGTDPTVQTDVRLPTIGRKLDVLVKTDSGERIAIENQFSEADHDHLTRALAYAVGLEATTVIVVAESHKPEFIAVANYLNEAAVGVGEQGIRFILIGLSVWGMQGADLFHPTFAVVAQPNEWKAAASADEAAGDSDRAALMYEFHDRLLPALRERTGLFQNVATSANNWKRSSAGVRNTGILYRVNRDTATISIWISAVRAPEVNLAGLRALEAHRQEIEAVLAPHEVKFYSEGTSSVFVVIQNAGYESEVLSEAKTDEVASVIRTMYEIANKYKTEMEVAMDNASPLDDLADDE